MATRSPGATPLAIRARSIRSTEAAIRQRSAVPPVDHRFDIAKPIGGDTPGRRRSVSAVVIVGSLSRSSGRAHPIESGAQPVMKGDRAYRRAIGWGGNHSRRGRTRRRLLRRASGAGGRVRDRDHHLRGALGAGAVGRRRLDRGRGRRRRPRRSLGTQHAGVGHGLACRAVHRRLGRPRSNTRYTAVEAAALVARAGCRVVLAAGELGDRSPATEAAAMPGPVTVVSLGAALPGPGLVAELVSRLLERRTRSADGRAHAGRRESCAVHLGHHRCAQGRHAPSRRHGETTARWAEVVGLTEGDCYPVVSPFSHIGGHKTGLLACLVASATTVPVAAFDPARFERFVPERGSRSFQGPPTLFPR